MSLQPKEDTDLLAAAVESGSYDGLVPAWFVEKGRGVTTIRIFKKGEFVLEYKGELINKKEAMKRDARYSKDERKGSFLFFFKFQEQTLCIDATAEDGHLGRLVNHSKKGNLSPKAVYVAGKPRILFFAARRS